MTPYEIEQLDQERCVRQADIAEVLFIDGFSDGLGGVPPQSQDIAYCLGYSKGSAERQQPALTDWTSSDFDEF